MQNAAYFWKKARQCSRLAMWIGDERASADLTDFAGEFEAKARATEASDRIGERLGVSAALCRNNADDSTRGSKPHSAAIYALA